MEKRQRNRGNLYPSVKNGRRKSLPIAACGADKYMDGAVYGFPAGRCFFHFFSMNLFLHESKEEEYFLGDRGLGKRLGKYKLNGRHDFICSLRDSETKKQEADVCEKTNAIAWNQKESKIKRKMETIY